MTSLVYFFCYLFETLTYFLFFENLYYRKRGKLFCFFVYAAGFLLQYGLSFIEIPIINLIAFAVITFSISLICYEAKLHNYIFASLLLSVVMLITELTTLFVFTYIFKINLDEYTDNLLVLVIQASLAKLLFFIVTFFFSKYYITRYDKDVTSKYYIFLSVLPLTSLVIFHIMFYWGVKSNDTSGFNGALAICSVLLLFANIFVFYIYEKVQSTNYEITQLKLQQQKGEISTEYYKLLSDEYNKQRIVIHDIKNHFQSIDVLAQKGDTEKLKRYIGNLTREMGINTNMVYTGNEMIDVIINRYRYAAWERGISFETESISSGLAFMEDNDVVAMLDNLLDNAIESAEKSQGKKITLEIFVRNGGFVTVNVTNSCDRKPTLKDGILATIKQNTENHGIGTKSIKRTAKKYGGNFKWNYDSENKLFCVSVVMSGEKV